MELLVVGTCTFRDAAATHMVTLLDAHTRRDAGRCHCWRATTIDIARVTTFANSNTSNINQSQRSLTPPSPPPRPPEIIVNA